MKSLQHSGKSYHLQEFLFVLALVTKPFYLTSSGSMQPSDFIYMALFGCFLLSGRIRFPGWKEKQWAAAFAYLIVYQFVINVIWYFICYFQDIEDLKMVTRIIYYIFNLFVCLSVFQMCVAVGYKRLLKLYLLGSALSLAVCYIGVALNWSGSGRVSGFFNNPNQLGYYAILMMSVFVIYCRETKKGLTILLIGLCAILNIWSLSKAALIGAAVLMVCYALISNEGKGVSRTVISVIAVIVVSTLLYLFMFSDLDIFSNNYYITKVRMRILNMAGENDSDLGSGRGYGRILEIGVLVIVGVGQGAYGRFAALTGKELHSTYASILVSYGLIGFFGYGYLFCKAIFSNKKRLFNLLAMAGILLYSVSHDGIRSSLLWTLLAMLLLRPHGEEDNSPGQLQNPIGIER